MSAADTQDLSAWLDALVLTRGSHAPTSGEYCALEAVAHLAGVPHTDRPAPTCPVLAAYVRGLNDARWSSDTARTAALRPWLLRLVGTRADAATEQARVHWLAHRALSHWAPLAADYASAALERAGVDCADLRALAAALRATPTVAAALRLCRVLRGHAHVAAYAAADAAAAATVAADAYAYAAADAYAYAATVAAGAAAAADADAYAAADAVLTAAVEDLGALLEVRP